jgi:hypothetical protein
MSEAKRVIRFKKDSALSSEDVWLGAESHMPNLSRELRRRERNGVDFSSGWVIGAMFAVGVAAGCLAMRLFDRQSRPS